MGLRSIMKLPVWPCDSTVPSVVIHPFDSDQKLTAPRTRSETNVERSTLVTRSHNYRASNIWRCLSPALLKHWQRLNHELVLMVVSACRWYDVPELPAPRRRGWREVLRAGGSAPTGGHQGADLEQAGSEREAQRVGRNAARPRHPDTQQSPRRTAPQAATQRAGRRLLRHHVGNHHLCRTRYSSPSSPSLAWRS